MKIYLSADIEGVTGSTHWDETDASKADYQAFREQMTAEVAAACQAALEAGATEIWVKDAHDNARNIFADKLPREARLVRGWGVHPMMMMQELDHSFQAAMLVGYHSRAGANTSPLAHTLTGLIHLLTINGVETSEFRLSAYAAGYYQVPMVFVSGDQGLCEEINAFQPHITTVAVKQGHGDSTINLHPQVAIERIKAGVTQALHGHLAECQVSLPEHFEVEVTYRQHVKAFMYSFYPGARLVGPRTIRFETDDFFEVMRLLMFVA